MRRGRVFLGSFRRRNAKKNRPKGTLNGKDVGHPEEKKDPP